MRLNTNEYFDGSSKTNQGRSTRVFLDFIGFIKKIENLVLKNFGKKKNSIPGCSILGG